MYKRGEVVGYVDLSKPPPIAELGPSRWHIVLTAGNAEKSTLERLKEELQLEAYLPLQHDRVNAGRNRIRIVERPMFPRYFFVHMPEHRRAWSQLRDVRGVEDFLAFPSGRPKLLKDEAVLAIRWHEGVVNGKWLQDQVRKQESPFEIGQEVWADVLPFKRVLAKVTGFDKKGNVAVLLEMEMMGRKQWPLEPRLLHPVLD